MIKRCLAAFLLFCAVTTCSYADLSLRHNLHKAKAGDYIVTSQNRTNTLLMVTDRTDSLIRIQEISIAEGRFPAHIHSWREWLNQNAPGHTAWIVYDLDAHSGQLLQVFSYTQNCRLEGAAADSYLGTLLNLNLEAMNYRQRRRVGPSQDGGKDTRGLWQPRLVVEGQVVPGATFSAWKARWPNDGSELAGKTIELYLPEQEGNYPSYFPYWVQVSGVVGKARMRIVDSGTLPIPPPKK